MKKLLVIGLLLVSPSLLFAQKEDISEFDGSNWARWTPIENISFLNGFISAAAHVVSAGSGGVFYSVFITGTEYNDEKAQNARKTFYDIETKQKVTFSRQDVSLILDSEIKSMNEGLSKLGIYGITAGQFHDGLNLFYNDFKNKQIKLHVGIYVVKKQIEGASTEETEALVQWLRGGGKDFSKRFYIDKEGKKKYISFP